MAFIASAASFRLPRPGRVALRAKEHEVVVHHRGTRQAVSGSHELLLSGRGVHQQHVRVPAGTQRHRLARPDRDRLDLALAASLELRQQLVERPESCVLVVVARMSVPLAPPASLPPAPGLLLEPPQAASATRAAAVAVSVASR
jgi:hypothetical protein